MLSREVFLLHLKLAFDKKRSLFKPKPLELDHFFLRGSLQVIEKSIHSVSSVEKMTSGQPLPILDEPSDHLPIEATIDMSPAQVWPVRPKSSNLASERAACLRPKEQ